MSKVMDNPVSLNPSILLPNLERSKSHKINLGDVSLIQSARIRRSRSKIKKDWNKIFTESNLRLIQVMKQRKNEEKAFENKKGWKLADPNTVIKKEKLQVEIPEELKQMEMRNEENETNVIKSNLYSIKCRFFS